MNLAFLITMGLSLLSISIIYYFALVWKPKSGTDLVEWEIEK